LRAAQADHGTSMVRAIAESAAATAAAIGTAAPIPVVAPPISECAAAFIREKGAVSVWNEKTLERVEFNFRIFTEAMGDCSVSAVKREHITQFLERLKRLPSNAGKKPGLKGKTFLELTDVLIEGYPLISGTTIKDHMVRVAGFFKWCLKIEAYGLTRNPAVGFDLVVKDRTGRKPFSESQLVDLFSHRTWLAGTFLHPYQYWLMPMAALTGMRINELCQLRLVDFVRLDDVDIIECADLDEGQRAKNPNAKRRVPIHGVLIRMGLLRYVEKLRKAGQLQLFPELKPSRDGHGQVPSKWFGRYRAECGIEGKQQFVFHSFRHLFIAGLLNKSVAEHMVAAIAGHETGLVTGTVYWNDRDAAKLLGVVELASLPDSVLPLLRPIESVKFQKVTRRPPSRFGTRKSRAKRIEDAALRKLRAKKSAP
jgi:integrase